VSSYFDRIIQEVSEDSYRSLAEGLIDILLASQNTACLEKSTVVQILTNFKEEKDATKPGLKLLFESAIVAEHEKTIALIQKLGLQPK